MQPEESLRTADRRLPRCPGVDPRIGRTHDLQRRRGAATAQHDVSVHAAARRTLESRQKMISSNTSPDGTSRPRVQPVAAHLTPMAVADLTRYYSTALDQHLADPLGLIPLAIFDLLCIYTFQNGNGRISRLLNLCCFTNSTTPWVAISAYSASSRTPRKAIRDTGSKLTGLASRATRRQTLARLLPVSSAAGLPRV